MTFANGNCGLSPEPSDLSLANSIAAYPFDFECQFGADTAATETGLVKTEDDDCLATWPPPVQDITLQQACFDDLIPTGLEELYGPPVFLGNTEESPTNGSELLLYHQANGPRQSISSSELLQLECMSLSSPKLPLVLESTNSISSCNSSHQSARSQNLRLPSDSLFSPYVISQRSRSESTKPRPLQDTKRSGDSYIDLQSLNSKGYSNCFTAQSDNGTLSAQYSDPNTASFSPIVPRGYASSQVEAGRCVMGDTCRTNSVASNDQAPGSNQTFKEIDQFNLSCQSVGKSAGSLMPGINQPDISRPAIDFPSFDFGTPLPPEHFYQDQASPAMTPYYRPSPWSTPVSRNTSRSCTPASSRGGTRSLSPATRSRRRCRKQCCHGLPSTSAHRRRKLRAVSKPRDVSTTEPPRNPGDFINLGLKDGSLIMDAVAPSGGFKTQERRERQAAERHTQMSGAILRAIHGMGDDRALFEYQGAM